MALKIGSLSRNFLEGTSTSDTLHGYVGADYFYGDARTFRGTARGGADTIWAGSDRDTVYGDAYAMSSSTVGGSDKV